MIRVYYVSGLACPVLYCDVCGQRILRSDEGNAVSALEPRADGDAAAVYFVHKGRCDEAAKVRLGGGGRTGWDPIYPFLKNLSDNLSRGKPVPVAGKP